ncbi:MAG: alpha/beta hydrolase [Ktedonobacterales bacterium]
MTNDTASKVIKGQYATINGLNVYYEVHGEGMPLVLLPGGFMTVAAMGTLVPELAQTRQVIAVELEGHGHTALAHRPLRWEQMADDIAALIASLGLTQVDVMGYSLGGGVALQTAIRHPEVVRKLVLVSAPCQRNGWYPEVLGGMAAITPEVMAGTPIYEEYASAAPKPEDFATFVVSVRTLLGQDYDWSADVAKLPMPTLIAIGDADSVRTAHAVEMFGLLGGGKADGGFTYTPKSELAILPGVTHFTIVRRLDLLLPILTTFLDAPLPAAGE